MRITITTDNKVFSAEDEFGFESSTIHDAVEIFKGLLVCAGFHPSNVDDAFNIDYTWFTEEERNGNTQGHLNGSNKIVNDWHKECEGEALNSYNKGYAKGWDEALHNKKVQEFQDDLYRPEKVDEYDGKYDMFK